MKDTFANRLKELRKAHNLTQEELANAVGVTKGTVSVWERGGRRPDFEALNAMSKFFDVDMGYLICQDRSTHIEVPDDLEVEPELRMLRGMGVKLAQLSLGSLMIVESAINTAYKVDEERGELETGRSYTLAVREKQ